MSGQHNVRVTDEQFNEIFAEKHGAEEREYYAHEPNGPGSTWQACVDSLAGRGRCGRVAPAPRSL